MKKLFVYMKEYRKESVLGPLFKLCEAALELAVPLLVAAIIDKGIGAGDRSYIARMCALLVGFGVAGLGFSVTAQYFAAKAAVGFVTKVRRALFDHVQKLSYAQLDTLGAPTLITRMTSDVNQVQNGVNLALRLLLRSPFVVFGAMLMAFTIDARAAGIFAAVIAALLVVVFAIMLVCIPLYRRVQTKLDGVTALTRENLTGARVLRAFCREEQERESFRQRNEALTKTQKFVGRVSALMNPLTYVLINGATIWLIWTGAVRADAGLLTQGAVVALYNYMLQILTELIKLANLIISITKAVACGNRIEAVLEEKPAMRETAIPPAAPALHTGAQVEFRDAQLRYSATGDSALSDVAFSVRRGETVGIIGGTGAGKTSLVSLIPRFYDVSAGSVLVDGVDVREYPLDALRARIGFVPQKAVLFAGTIRENLLWGKSDATDAELLAAVDAAQARDVLDGREGGLDAPVEQGGRNLSGGQRQRLTIARALVRQPEILILDDSASALDFATDAALRRAIRALPSRPTVFVVSQRAASVRLADKIVVLDDGAVAGIGAHDALLESCAVYREIFESQFRREDAR
ncbi:MAG: ABC transporter ATP-binding protein [Oscillospiraceae bacterium]|nr:ABC transporter ATP-binding protein [Oscillospiraceae bacterium]